MKSALITGITGQDGAYLSQFLLKKGYKVFGTYRRLSTPNFWRLQYLDIFDKINLVPADMTDMTSLLEAVKISNPNEVYNLAANSFVGSSFEQPIQSTIVTGIGVMSILEAIRQMKPDARLYQASTSELYGTGRTYLLNEKSVFNPCSPYAIAKQCGYYAVKVYRDAYKMFCSNGILFNHESPIRGLEFVTRKITNSVAKIKLGLQDKLVLGNLDARRDWGYALDYVRSMWMILNADKPDDFVIATAESHSVKEFVQKAFEVVGLDWKDHVAVDKKFMRPLDVSYLCGNYAKAFTEFGWEPTVKFEELIKLMVKEDLSRWKMWQQGKSFPWDAQNFPNENQILSTKIKLEGI